VTVQKVRVHKSATAGDNEAGWSEVVLNPAQRIDLLSLTNGVLADLGQTPLPAGRYTQMRLVLAGQRRRQPDGERDPADRRRRVALTTPSGAQSGLKMNVGIDVAANQLADFVLDFDACKSFVKLGKLEPVPAEAGDPRRAARDDRHAGRRLCRAGARRGRRRCRCRRTARSVKSTPPDSNGKFVLYPVEVGTYDLVVSAQGRATAIVTGVPVTETAFTTINLSSAPIDPPASAMHSASGTVARPAIRSNAAVSAVKKYTGGPNVVVADGPVDGTTGAFGYSLPSAPPVKTAYMPSDRLLELHRRCGIDGRQVHAGGRDAGDRRDARCDEERRHRRRHGRFHRHRDSLSRSSNDPTNAGARGAPAFASDVYDSARAAKHTSPYPRCAGFPAGCRKLSPCPPELAWPPPDLDRSAHFPPALVAGRREPAHGHQPAVSRDRRDRGRRLVQERPPPLAEKTALVLDLQGRIAEQKSGNLRQSALNELRGNDTSRKVQLRDVREVLAAAAADPKIERAVLVSTISTMPASRRCARSLRRSIASGPPASRSSPGVRATTSASTTSPRMPTRCCCIRSAWSISRATGATATTTRMRSTGSASAST
jgi:hypothetical protein